MAVDVLTVTDPPLSRRFVVPDRIDELDGIRGFAAILVVFHHLSQSFPGTPASSVLRLWLAVTHAGWIGVDVFFALSGFLITRALLNTKGRPHYYKNFYIRRVLRLAAPYFLTLALVACFIPHSFAFLVLSFFYLANFAHPFGIDMVYGPLWSLAVEEHFYLVWPWLIRFLKRKTLFILALAICIATPLFRFVAQKYGFFDPYVSWFRFDGILWGALLALLSGSPRVTRKQVLTWSIAVGGLGGVAYVGGAFLGAMARNSVLGSSVVFGVVAMATTGVIGLAISASGLKALVFLRNPVARFFGDISYWTYLFHGLMVNLALRLTLGWKPGWATYFAMTGIVFSACIMTGIAVRHWIELPAQALKKRFH